MSVWGLVPTSGICQLGCTLPYKSQLCDSLPQSLKRFPSHLPLRFFALRPFPASCVLGRRGLQTKLPFQLERACVGILRPVLDYVYFPSTSRLVFVRPCGFVSLLPALSRPSSCGPRWPYYIVPPYRPSRFCSSVWLRFAPARPIASVVLWPRGLTTLSLRTGRLVFARRRGFVSLLPALSRPSSRAPVALLICPSVPPVFPLSSSRVLP